MVVSTQKEQIVFSDDGMVEHQVDGKVVKREDGLVLVPDFARTLSLPHNCKMYRRDRDRIIFVIENKPRVHEVSWNYINDAWWDDLVGRGCLERYGLTEGDRARRIFNLAFPYVVFVVQVDARAISGVKVFFRDGPIRTASDYLYLPALTGCNPKTADVRTPFPEWRANSTPVTVTEELVAMFWRNSFDDYLPDLFTQCQVTIPELRTVWDWEFHSRDNQLWVLGAKWPHFEHSIGKLIDNLVSNGMSTDRNRRIYEQFVRNIAAGDTGQSRNGGDGFVESPSFSVLFSQGPVRIGDILIAHDSMSCGVKHRGEYTVIHFYEPRDDGHRYAKLEGIEDPVVLGRGDLEYFEIKQPEREPVVSTFDVDGFTVSVGCRLIAENEEDLPHIRVGRQYKIRQIEIDRQGDAKVVLSDYDSHVYITYDGGKLLPSLRLVRPEIIDNTFRYEDTTVSVGDYIMVHRAESDAIRGKILRVNKLWQEDGKPGIFYISFGGIGGKYVFCSGSEIKITQEKMAIEISDERIYWQYNEIVVGKVIRIESSVLRDQVARVARFERKTGADADPLDYDVYFDGVDQAVPLVSGSRWQLQHSDTVAEVTESTIRFDEHSLDLEGLGYVFAKRSGLGVPLFSVNKVKAVRPSTKPGAHPFDMEMSLQGVKDPIAIINESQWRFDGFTRVIDGFQVHGILNIKQGAKLQVASDGIDGTSVGDVYEVLYFADSPYNSDVTEVIFTDGQAVPFTKQSMACFTRSQRGGKFASFSERQLSAMPEVSTTKGGTFQNGDRVQYLGSRWTHKGRLGTVASQVHNGSSIVQFEAVSGHDDAKYSIENKLLEHVGVEFKLARRFWAEGSERMLRRHDGSLIPLPSELEVPETKGKLAGEDHYGRPIHIGDVVIALQCSGSSGACQHNAVGEPGVVVHNVDGYPGVYIDFGRNVGGGGFSSGTYGYENLPEEYKDRIKRKHVTLVKKRHSEVCEIVEGVEFVDSAPEQQTMLRRHDGSLIPMPAGLIGQLDRGSQVGNDRHRKFICIGDIVTVRRYGNCQDHIDHSTDVPALVVSTSGLFADKKVHLYFAEPVDYTFATTSCSSCRSNLNPEFADRLQQTALTTLDHCEVLEVIETSSSVSAAAPIEIGDVIRFKSGITEPRFGWGGTSRNDLGVVTEASSDTLTTFFGPNNGYRVSRNDVELFEMREGTKVQMREHCHVRGGHVDTGELGTVQSIHDTGEWLIRFENSGLKISPVNKLQYVEESTSPTGEYQPQVGDRVKIRPDLGVACYGFGGMEDHRDEIGEVFRVGSNGECDVRFPSQNNWEAGRGELVSVDETVDSTSSTGEYRPRVGDRVRFNPATVETISHLGAMRGHTDEIGVVREVDPRGCYVDFPSYRGWSSGPGDLVPVDGTPSTDDDRFSEGDRVRLRPGVEPRLEARGSLTDNDIGVVDVHDVDDHEVYIRFREYGMLPAHPDDTERVPFVIGDQVRFRSGITPRHGQGQLDDGVVGRVEDISRSDVIRVNFDPRHSSWGCHVEDIEVVRPEFAEGNRVRLKPNLGTSYDSDDVEPNEIGTVTRVSIIDGELEVNFADEMEVDCHPDDVEIVEDELNPVVPDDNEVEEGMRVRLLQNDRVRLLYRSIDGEAVGTVLGVDGVEITVNFPGDTPVEAGIADVLVLPIIPGDRVRFRLGIEPRLRWPPGVSRDAVGRVVRTRSPIGEPILVDFPARVGWNADPNDLEIVNPEFAVGNRVRFKPNLGTFYDSGSVDENEVGVVVNIAGSDGLEVDFPSEHGMICKSGDVESVGGDE